MTVAGSSLRISKFNVDLGNTVQLVKDPSCDSGYLQSMITGRKSKFSATVYQENLGSSNPLSIMAGPTPGLFQMTWGIAGSRITLKSGSGKCQITNVKQANDNGLNTFELSGIFIDNDFSLVINDA